MNEQELNKKLAERDTSILLKKLNDWAGTEDIDYLSEESGLSACFKWLVPILRDLSEENTLQDIEFHWQGLNVSNVIECNLITDESEYDGESEKPALAFCLASEKLIEGKV